MVKGDHIEFLSGDGTWKPGILDEIYKTTGTWTKSTGRWFARIQVSPILYIRRSLKRNGEVVIRLRKQE